MTEEERKARAREADKRYKARHAEAVRAQKREYYRLNKERLRAYQKEYHANANDKLRAQRAAANKRFRAANPDKVKAYKIAYRERHRAKLAEQSRAYKAANPDKVKETRKRYYEKNREARLDYCREWYARNKDRCNNSAKRRRARERAAAQARQEAERRANAAIWSQTNRKAFSADERGHYRAIRALVPRHLNHDIREDVVADVVIGLYDGEFDLTKLDLATVQGYVRRHLQARGWYSDTSLDATVNENGVRLVDLIPSDHEHF